MELEGADGAAPPLRDPFHQSMRGRGFWWDSEGKNQTDLLKGEETLEDPESGIPGGGAGCPWRGKEMGLCGRRPPQAIRGQMGKGACSPPPLMDFLFAFQTRRLFSCCNGCSG